MKKLMLSGLVLLGISEILAATAVLDPSRSDRPLSADSGSAQSEIRRHPTVIVLPSTIFSIDEFLTNPSIALNSGRTLMVKLDEELKAQLSAEKSATDRPFTDKFVKYFEKTKTARVSDDVIGFVFGLDDSHEIYRQTFLGENAK